MANNSGHRDRREPRKQKAALSRVIGTSHGEDVVLKEEQTPGICCGGSCGKRSVHTTANLQKYGIKIYSCTSKTCQLRVRDLINEQVSLQKRLAKEPSLQPIGRPLSMVKRAATPQVGAYAV